eukprot:TRINITY_DN73519_c0_g1_i1.p1 TRINITY_DN73519_c0_g1~~TRINITY_DN73519_c0_g1_i1.p1  ORF type:complete len:247 (+),score=31.70 TRINITY_DN73519_c0_g1_i1:75-815(+)
MDSKKFILSSDDVAGRDGHVPSIVSGVASIADDDAPSVDACTRLGDQPLLSEIPLPSKISVLNDAIFAKGPPPGLTKHASKLHDVHKQAPKLISLFHDLDSSETNRLQPYDGLDIASQDSFKEAFLLALNVKRAGKPVQRQYHKTQLCRFYVRGQCYLGDECMYAHTRDELQAPPSLKKTKLCNKFLRQQCFKEDCNFAHGYKELRATDLLYKTSFCRWFARDQCKAGAYCRYAHSTAELRNEGPA